MHWQPNGVRGVDFSHLNRKDAPNRRLCVSLTRPLTMPSARAVFRGGSAGTAIDAISSMNEEMLGKVVARVIENLTATQSPQPTDSDVHRVLVKKCPDTHIAVNVDRIQAYKDLAGLDAVDDLRNIWVVDADNHAHVCVSANTAAAVDEKVGATQGTGMFMNEKASGEIMKLLATSPEILKTGLQCMNFTDMAACNKGADDGNACGWFSNACYSKEYIKEHVGNMIENLEKRHALPTMSPQEKEAIQAQIKQYRDDLAEFSAATAAH